MPCPFTLLALADWKNTVLNADVLPRGWHYISTWSLTHSIDDGSLSIPFPFSFSFLGTSYTEVYVGSNTYLTFGAGSSTLSGFSASNPPHPTIFVAAADNSVQRIGYSTDWATYVLIRFVKLGYLHLLYPHRSIL